MDILEQIKAGYSSFSRPRQRISDFILNNPEQCCFLSLKSFADQVCTTEVTVLNFCRGLGLNSYMALKKALQEKGYQLYLDSPTNQQFVVLENKKKEELGKKVQFDFWEKYDDTHTVIRFATSWATTKEDVDALCNLLCNL